MPLNHLSRKFEPVMQLAEAMVKVVLVFVTVEALTVKVPPRFTHPVTFNLIRKSKLRSRKQEWKTRKEVLRFGIIRF